LPIAGNCLQCPSRVQDLGLRTLAVYFGRARSIRCTSTSRLPTKRFAIGARRSEIFKDRPGSMTPRKWATSTRFRPCYGVSGRERSHSAEWLKSCKIKFIGIGSSGPAFTRDFKKFATRFWPPLRARRAACRSRPGSDGVVETDKMREVAKDRLSVMIKRFGWRRPSYIRAAHKRNQFIADFHNVSARLGGREGVRQLPVYHRELTLEKIRTTRISESRGRPRHGPRGASRRARFVSIQLPQPKSD